MSKPNPNETTVLLLHQDAGLKEDPYLAFLRTIPHLEAANLGTNLSRAWRQMVDAIRECVNAPGDFSPENVEALRGLLVRIESGMPPEEAISDVRHFAALAFKPTSNLDHAEDLDTLHTGVVPNTHGTPPDLDQIAFETGWEEWTADRRRLRENGSVCDSALDVLMGQLREEGVDVEEAEAAVVGLLIKESEENLARELRRLDRKKRRA